MKKLIKKILQEQEEETPPKGTYHREGDVEEWRINPYEFNTTNYKEMLDFVDKLPNTIDEITVPTELQLHNPAKVVFNPSKHSDWKDKIKEIIIATTRRGDIISYSVHSYYGTGNKDYDKHPYYISFELAGSKEFGDAMRSMVS
tara:strand:+ start:685 stop:1116 length:432 start_codon:yes stop_codon:yes gene_type:complete